MSVLEREAEAIAAHRASLRGAALLAPRGARPDGKPLGPPTFAHGFLLPFTLVVATLRDAGLRVRYLRATLVRTAIVVVVGGFAIANGAVDGDRDHDSHRPDVHIRHDGKDVVDDDDNDEEAREAVKKWAPGASQAVDEAIAQAKAEKEKARAEEAQRKPPSLAARIGERIRESWRWLLAALTFLAVLEAMVTFFSRRWDDYLGFYASALARIRPEQTTPPAPPKVAADFKWLYRKARRRVRGYVVFAAGVPMLYPVNLLPVVGGWIFTLLLTLWSWYWLGVFSAAKTAHAWVDEGAAPPPLAIRALNDRVQHGRLFWPLRIYGQLWARLTRGVFPAAAVFERAPQAFLGFALARAILSLPGLYFVARPIVPVAAGRLVAESDPWDRFSAS